MSSRWQTKQHEIGLILSGGGARAAYQVGVLKAIAKLLPPERRFPFRIIVGTSAGAINATALAAEPSGFHAGIHQLELVWKTLHCHSIYRSDFAGVSKQILYWLASFFLGGMGRRNPRSFLDNSPLKGFLQKVITFRNIQASVAADNLKAVSVTALGYSSGQSVCFYEGDPCHNWQRAQRVGVSCTLSLEHLLASSAIPLVFPAARIHREYFGDGSIRQHAPVSPALHFGASKVLVIGVSPHARAPERHKTSSHPSLAQVAGQLLNGTFLDSLENDLERLQVLNRLLDLIPENKLEEAGIPMRKVDVLLVAPSKPLEALAAQHSMHFPWAVRYLLRGIGALRRGGSVLASYLLFEPPYTRDLIRLGYQDAMQQKEEILAFMGVEAPASTTQENTFSGAL
ncbi:patatin-like phospholipase family protein [Leeia aquatica]|uniref:Patatin-like phospholipase family protein n=1 Tax=Leeia aquatica TaxID=2725557 RepID=A0A847SDW7_9NEIS|nr:patatin-like phospholipase family protein [Leeia aquatica]NLR75368.1 patatin-like phospholipase family protein [Leeia aquatica]